MGSVRCSLDGVARGPTPGRLAVSAAADTLPRMRTYEITYHVLPAGVGPDDYETKDLEERTGRFAFPDPGPDDVYELDGEQHAYGPAYPDVKAAIAATLQEGETPIFSAHHMRRVD